ncbi:MAG: efflux RND transporter periplasmic adaptor subunit [Oceanicoccus sp.]
MFTLITLILQKSFAIVILLSGRRHLFAVLAVVSSMQGFADPLAVATMALRHQDSYVIERVYGGVLSSRRSSDMGFETSGIIGVVNVDEGDSIAKGDVLISLDDASLQADIRGAKARLTSANANVLAQRAELGLKKLTLQRNQQLSKEGHVSGQRLDELSQQLSVSEAMLLVAQTQISQAEADYRKIQVILDKSVLRAPYDAIVQQRNIDEGSIISPGQTVIRILEQGHVEARVGIPESMVHLLSPSTTYQFVTNNQSIAGRLKATLPRVNETTGTVTALFTLETDQSYLGSLATMQLSVEVNSPGYWVPISAISESQRGLWSVLVVAGPEDSATIEPRLVEIIHQGQDAVFVRGTLLDGELIIPSGVSRVVPGQTVRVEKREPPLSITGR